MSPPVTLDDTLTAAKDVIAREVDGEIIILSLDRASYFGINRSGASVWQAILDRRPLREASAVIEREFGIPAAQADSDVLDLARQLLDAGLVGRISDGPAP